jgi:hypothetical protein
MLIVDVSQLLSYNHAEANHKLPQEELELKVLYFLLKRDLELLLNLHLNQLDHKPKSELKISSFPINTQSPTKLK